MVPNDPEEEEAEPGDQTGALAFDPDLIAAAEGKPRSEERRSARLRGKPRPNYSGKTTRGDRAKEAAVEQFCGLVAAVEAGLEKITLSPSPRLWKGPTVLCGQSHDGTAGQVAKARDRHPEAARAWYGDSPHAVGLCLER